MAETTTTAVIVTAHRSVVPTDPNNRLNIAAVDGRTRYVVTGIMPDGRVELAFQTLEQAGLTNEALLAIVYDRLTGFQAGQLPCEENARAIGHVSAALHNLKNRTNRRHLAGTEGKMIEEQEKMAEATKAEVGDAGEKKHRVRLEGNTLLVVGDAKFTTKKLAEWATWSAVETAVKRLDPELSALELDVIEQAAAHLGGGARNGLSELKSALATQRYARK
jgi:hypothetical protein